MLFTVLVACDLGGKCNFSFAFPEKPTLAELRARVDAALAAEAAQRVPHPFKISRIQVFDERLQMWVDLVAAVQLEDYCQLYAFQVESAWSRDLPGQIPAPQRPIEDPGSVPRAGGRSVSPPRARPAQFTPDPPSVSPRRGGPDAAPSHHEKVRACYDEMDVKRTRRVNLDDWCAAFAKLRVGATEDGTGLTRETVEDLFKKADRDSDAVVSFTEFQWFGESYPKLLDCLYYRARAQVHDNARKANLERARNEEETLRQRLEEANQAADEQEAQELEGKSQVDDTERAVADALEEEQAAKQARDAAHQVSEEARRELREQAAKTDGAKEQVRQKDAQIRQAQRGVDAAEKKQKQRQAEVDRVQKEIERLMKLLEHKREELGKLEEELSGGAQEIEDAAKAVTAAEEAKGLAEAEAQSQKAGSDELDARLKEALAAEGEAAQRHRQIQRDAADAKKRAEQAQKDAATQKRMTAAKRQAAERAERALGDCTGLVKELEQRDQELDEKRTVEEEKENSIVEGEIRLREQRAAVEAQEHALAQAHTDFSQEMQRVASPCRGSRS